MGWSLRVLRHRAAAQRTLLATVLAVALVGASLLGTFALLLFSSENRAMDAALTRAPAAATDIDIDLTLERGSPLGATEAGEAFLDELLGDIPSTRAQWLTSPLYRLLSEGDTVGSPMAYLAVNPEIPDHATLAAGAWPGPGADESRVEVAVPKVAADRYGWTVGTELPLRNLTTYEQSTVAVVVGIHELGKPRSLWTRDLLQGAQHDPRYPVPGSFGFVATDAWGPFVVAPEALTATGSVATARLVASPQLADSPPGAVEAVRERLDDAQATLVADTEFDVVTAQFRSRLAATIDVAQGNLAVTRVSLVIVGLMLVVLAVTVLLLAARLLADRRAPEQTLMSSRGASGRQLLGLAALEAAGVALVTTLVSPWLAVLLFQAITSVGLLAEAGLHHDPGRPASLWITCVVSSFVLAGVLLGPLLRRRGSVVDAEQQLVRQDRRGGLARSGADLALVVLAALAVWQLRSYRSPVVEAGSGRLDPVLVAAPALLLLAGAVLALRLLPLVARAGERLATRSRSLIAPLAAWEVGRRPGRAAGAVLLLTLALAVGSFSQSFLDTWRTSQGDQVDLAVGTDVRLDRVDGSGIAQATAVDALADVQALSPVTFRSVTMGHPADAPGESRGRSVDLLAHRHHAGGRPAARPDLTVLGHDHGTPATRRTRDRHRAPGCTDQPPARRRDLPVPRRQRGPAGQRGARGSARDTDPGRAGAAPARRRHGRRRGHPAGDLAGPGAGGDRGAGPPRPGGPRGPVRAGHGRRAAGRRRAGAARRRASRRRHRGHRDPRRDHRGAVDRAGRAAGEQQPAPDVGPDRRRGPARQRRDRPARGPLRALRVRRGDVRGAGPDPGRRDRHAGGRARRGEGRRAPARPGRGARAGRRRAGGRLPAGSAQGLRRPGRPGPAHARGAARLVDERAAGRVVAPGPRRERARRWSSTSGTRTSASPSTGSRHARSPSTGRCASACRPRCGS